MRNLKMFFLMLMITGLTITFWGCAPMPYDHQVVVIVPVPAPAAHPVPYPAPWPAPAPIGDSHTTPTRVAPIVRTQEPGDTATKTRETGSVKTPGRVTEQPTRSPQPVNDDPRVKTRTR